MSETRKTMSLLVHVLVILFSVRAWVELSGIWVELPILVDHLPEGWALASYLSVIIQLANIFVVIYTVVHIKAPNVVSDVRVIRCIIVLGGIACLIIAFCWDKTSIIVNEEYSTALMAVTFFMGGMACCASVVFVTFMSAFKAPYLTSMFMGEGIGQLTVSLVALAQGVGNTVCGNITTVETFLQNSNGTIINVTHSSLMPVLHPPRFSPTQFFLIVLGLEVISASAFLALDCTPLAKQERTENANSSKADIVYLENKLKDTQNNETELSSKLPNAHEEKSCRMPVSKYVDKPNKSLELTSGGKSTVLVDMTSLDFAFVLFMTGWNNCVWNGIGRTLQTYACLPFGSNIYHLSVILAEAANPLACFFAMFVPTSSRLTLSGLWVLVSGVGGYVIYTASLSPNPPLVGTMLGDIITVLSQMCLSGIATYSKVCLAGICRGQSRRAAMWFGVVLQGGSLAGALMMFLLVTLFQLFESSPLCGT